MQGPFPSMRRAVALILAAAFALGACGSSPSDNHDRDTGPDEDASKGALDSANPGKDSGTKVAEGSMSDAQAKGDAPGPPEADPPDEGILDTGMPETLEGEGGLMVTWTLGCWYETGGMKYQAMSFTVESGTPLPLEGTLYYNATCDPSDGTDNLNDTGATTPSGSWTFWFIHHPGETNTSAIWSYGGVMSACINYNTAPDC